MTTKGLVHGAFCALAATLASACLAHENEVQLTSLLEEAEAAASADCAAQCCDECISCSDPAKRMPFWYAGTETTFLNLDATSGGRITLSFTDTTAPGVATSAFDDGNGVNDVFTYAPRIWFGRQFGEKWGVVTRFWNLETSDQNNPPAFNPAITQVGTNFATIFETDRAHLYTLDVEGVRSSRIGKWKIDGTLGARHAHIGVDSDLLAFGVFTSGNFVNLTLQNGFNFNGAGGTASLTGRRQIGNSPLTIFLSGRGSYLGGRTDSFGRSDGTVADSPSSPLVGAATVTRNNAEGELDIAEFQAGTQWDFQLRRLPVDAFFRVAVEYQVWDIDAPPTGGAGFGGTIGELTTNSFAAAGIGGADLIGLAIATGFTW